jgi:glycosyltransferase involved in cell wall biosynthesis
VVVLKGLFVYETPHPAHRAWAEAVGCEVPGAPALSRPGLVGRFRTKGWYRTLARNPVLVRRTIESTASSYEPPSTAPDLVLFEGWRQTACARHFPGSFKVLIGADWFPFVFREDARMLDYLRPFNLIVSVSEVHASFIPASVNPHVRVVHPSMEVAPSPPGEGPDCAFVGDVFEGLKGVPRSVELFERAFDDGRVFHVIGACDPRVAGRRHGNVIYHGRVPEDLKGELLGRCRYYLHWAVFDPHPVSTVEAMAHGLIPITSPTTGTHYLSVQVLGEGFDTTSVEAAAAALRRLDDGGGWRELRGRCQELSRGFSVAASTKEFREAVLGEHERWAASRAKA